MTTTEKKKHQKKQEKSNNRLERLSLIATAIAPGSRLFIHQSLTMKIQDMKKNVKRDYQQPTIDTLAMETVTMLCLSDLEDEENNTGETPEEEEEEALTRRFGWR